MIIFNFFRKHIIKFIAMCALLLFSLIAYIYLYNDNDDVKTFLPQQIEKTDDTDRRDEEEIVPVIYYSVDIKGQVNKPGVYELTEGKRVIDAINMAGGLTNNADVSVTNLSRRIFDEMVIIIYSKNEVKSFSNVIKTQSTVQKECIVHIENVRNDSCVENNDNSSEENTSNTKVSLNNATSNQLMTLPGIGESKALAIIDYREKNNGFKSIEELKNVSGIGDATFEKLKNYIKL